MNKDNFQYISLQFSIFTPSLSFSRKKIFGKIMSQFEDIFDGNPVSFPISDDAPKEIPRIILNSVDKTVKLEIAESRCNFFCYQKEDDVINEKDSLKLFRKVIKKYIEETKSVVGRLAVVSRKYTEIKDPGLWIMKKFCNQELIEDKFDNPKNIEFHHHRQYSLKNKFHINNWNRIKSGITQNDKSVVLLNQDINTLLEERYDVSFNIEDIKKFIEFSIVEQKAIEKKILKEE
jgi:hypothetical protein